MERVQAIAKSLNIPAPDVWVADSKSLQAESFTSNNVAVTTATLNLLNEREQDAILGHELGHRKNGDKDGFAGGLQVMAEFFYQGAFAGVQRDASRYAGGRSSLCIAPVQPGRLK